MKVGQRLLQKLQGKSKECAETVLNGIQEAGYVLSPFKVTQRVRNGKVVKHYESCLDKKCRLSITFSIQGDELLAIIVNDRIFTTKEEIQSGVNCQNELRDILKYIKLNEAKAYKNGKLAKPVAENIAKSAVEDLDEETKKALEELKELEKQRDELKKELEKLKKGVKTDSLQTDGDKYDVMDDEEIEEYLANMYEDDKDKTDGEKNEEDGIDYDKIFLDKMWIQKVKIKWHPPKGTFAKTTKPSKTAEIVCKGHKDDLKKSIASVNYFFARAGICKHGHKNYDPQWCKNKDKIIEELHKICKGDK